MTSTPQEVDVTQTQVPTITTSTTHNVAIAVTQTQTVMSTLGSTHHVTISVVQVQV